MSAAAPSTVRAHRVTAPWSEASVTWQSFADAYDPAAVASVDVNGYGVERSIELSALAQAWVDGTIANHGILLEQDPTGMISYKSSERSTVSQRPRFTVCYEASGATTSAGRRVTIERRVDGTGDEGGAAAAAQRQQQRRRGRQRRRQRRRGWRSPTDPGAAMLRADSVARAETS
jgi:hypothetical protein